MGVDFVKNRESHLTVTQNLAYVEAYKLVDAEHENFNVGDKILLKLTNGTYQLNVVTNTNPLEMTPYEPRRYVREDTLYRGSYLPERERTNLDPDRVHVIPSTARPCPYSEDECDG